MPMTKKKEIVNSMKPMGLDEIVKHVYTIYAKTEKIDICEEMKF